MPPESSLWSGLRPLQGRRHNLAVGQPGTIAISTLEWLMAMARLLAGLVDGQPGDIVVGTLYSVMAITRPSAVSGCRPNPQYQQHFLGIANGHYEAIGSINSILQRPTACCWQSLPIIFLAILRHTAPPILLSIVLG